MEHNTKHLDSRRDSSDEEKLFGDYLINLDDSEAVESSPFRSALEGLRDFGFETIAISHPLKDRSEQTSSTLYDEDTDLWYVTAHKGFPDTKKMIADNLGGEVDISAEITTDGTRMLEVAFGAGDYNSEFDPEDLNEMIWAYLEVIHKTLSNSWEGRKLPLASHKEN